MHEKKFRLDIRKNLITEGMVESWNKLSRRVVKSSLKVLKGDVCV